MMVHVFYFTGLDRHFKDAHMVILVEDLVILWRSDHGVQRVMDTFRRVFQH